MKRLLLLIAIISSLAAVAPPFRSVQAGADKRTGSFEWIIDCNHFTFSSIPSLSGTIWMETVTVYPLGGGKPAVFIFNGQESGGATVGFAIQRIEFTHNNQSCKQSRWCRTAFEVIYRSSETTCPIDAPLVIDMFVYYSRKPWGSSNAHTLTVFSGAGFPSEASLTRLMGGSLPDGFDYKRGPACWGGLYDDGSDKGYFVCDTYLRMKGERRSNLRNDPQGPAMDLIPKIRAYKRILNELGIPFQLLSDQ